MTEQTEAVHTAKNHQDIYDFLSSLAVGVLATVDAEGHPYATAIYYTCNDDFEVTFVTKLGTKKHDNLRRDNHAVLVVYEAVSQTVAQVIGSAHEITDIEKANDAFSNLLQTAMATSSSGIPPVSKLQAGGYVAYSIKPNEIRMAAFVRPETGGYEKMYKTIEFPDTD